VRKVVREFVDKYVIPHDLLRVIHHELLHVIPNDLPHVLKNISAEKLAAAVAVVFTF
jgi:hypothetical protein